MSGMPGGFAPPGILFRGLTNHTNEVEAVASRSRLRASSVSSGGHAQTSPGAGRAAVQAAWTAGKPRGFFRLDDLIVGTGRHEAPFRSCRAKKGDYRRSHAAGQMHGAGISGDQRVGSLQQGAGLSQ